MHQRTLLRFLHTLQMRTFPRFLVVCFEPPRLGQHKSHFESRKPRKCTELLHALASPSIKLKFMSRRGSVELFLYQSSRLDSPSWDCLINLRQWQTRCALRCHWKLCLAPFQMQIRQVEAFFIILGHRKLTKLASHCKTAQLGLVFQLNHKMKSCESSFRGTSNWWWLTNTSIDCSNLFESHRNVTQRLDNSLVTIALTVWTMNGSTWIKEQKRAEQNSGKEKLSSFERSSFP